MTDCGANVRAINSAACPERRRRRRRRDEYGIPGSTNQGRFQYTGQAWLPEIGMYHYKARLYSPSLGRFLQTDPIGYGDGMNMYAYVRNDPVNFVDPLGLRLCGAGPDGSSIQMGPCPSPGQDRWSIESALRGLADAWQEDREGRSYFSEREMAALAPQNACPTASVGEIRSNLPSKGVGAQIVDGVSSYIQGVAWGGTALAARVGLLGSSAQQQAINTNARLGQVWGQIQSNPGQTASFVGAVVSKYPIQLASRVGFAVVVSRAATPYIGLPVTGLAAYGTAFKEAYQHPDAVAAAVIVGESCK